jgi:signal transduction histidine kinase
VSTLTDDAYDISPPVLAQISRRGAGATVHRWVVFSSALTVLSGLTAVHLWVVYRERMPISWLEAILSGFATWYPWLILGPGVFALARRFTFEPGRLGVALAVHLPAALVFGVVHGGIRALVGPFVDLSHPIPAQRIIVGQLLLAFLSYWIFVFLCQAWHNYVRYRERELRSSRLESQLAQAQLEMLRMQLHPHFLFNTLHAVSTLLHRDPDAADEMLSQLSDLLRMTLENFGLQEVSLREELEFVRRYLDIQQMRFQDRLRVTIDVPAETLDARVPNQVLQPMVENAIHHGLEAHTGSGLIEIRARGRASMLQLTVRDDGPGLRANWQAAQQGGIGVSNTRARLKQLYGSLASLDLANHHQGGTVVTLLIPQPTPLSSSQRQGDAA